MGFVIASGVVDEGVMRLYVLGQSSGVRVYLEVSFHTDSNKLVVNFRTTDEDLLPYIVNELDLNTLFHDFVEIDA